YANKGNEPFENLIEVLSKDSSKNKVDGNKENQEFILLNSKKKCKKDQL
ncbi:10335_t:CDS:1, partial [Gigaspora rosea]